MKNSTETTGIGTVPSPFVNESSSEKFDELAKALVNAQKQISSAQKKSTNPYFNSKYSDLAEVWRVAQEVLPKNGFAISQITTYEGTQLVLKTVLMHTSGQFISGVLPITNLSDPQKMGICITYCRRYGLQAILSIPSEDCDAEGVMDRESSQKQPTKPTKPSMEPKDWEDLKGVFQDAEDIDTLNDHANRIWKNWRFDEDETAIFKELLTNARTKLKGTGQE